MAVISFSSEMNSSVPEVTNSYFGLLKKRTSTIVPKFGVLSACPSIIHFCLKLKQLILSLSDVILQVVTYAFLFSNSELENIFNFY